MKDKYEDPYLYDQYESDSAAQEHTQTEYTDHNPWAMYVLFGVVVVVALLIISYFLGWFGNRSAPPEEMATTQPVEKTDPNLPAAQYSEPGEDIAPQDRIDLRVLESFPVQIVAELTGTLSDPCREIVAVGQQREGNTFTLNVEEDLPQDGEECDQTGARTFKQAIPLEVIGLSKGLYTVKTDTVERSFELTVDNKVEDTPPEFIEQK